MTLVYIELLVEVVLEKYTVVVKPTREKCLFLNVFFSQHLEFNVHFHKNLGMQ